MARVGPITTATSGCWGGLGLTRTVTVDFRCDTRREYCICSEWQVAARGVLRAADRIVFGDNSSYCERQWTREQKLGDGKLYAESSCGFCSTIQLALGQLRCAADCLHYR